MKKKIIVILTLVIFSAAAFAQKDNLQDTRTAINDSILKELQIIRSIQEGAKKRIDSIRSARVNHTTLPEKKTEEDLLNEYEAMTQIADNTRQNFLKDDWNVYGWVAFFIALFSLIVSGVTLYAQWRTEDNTKKLNMGEQKALLSDMIRHFYRNYVVSLSLRVKLEAGRRGKKKSPNYTGYPSEEHIKKMMINLNDVHLNLFYKENERYQQMNKLYVMMRNYNIELDVICDHLKSQTIDYATKSRDLQTLCFKCDKLTEDITRLIGSIWHNNENAYIPQARERILNEQEKNRKENTDETKHYTGRFEINVPEKSFYLSTLFCNNPEQFLDDLKKDVQIECGQNTSGSPKIHIIKFQNLS